VLDLLLALVPLAIAAALQPPQVIALIFLRYFTAVLFH
jgi:hypothetical protein